MQELLCARRAALHAMERLVVPDFGEAGGAARERLVRAGAIPALLRVATIVGEDVEDAHARCKAAQARAEAMAAAEAAAAEVAGGAAPPPRRRRRETAAEARKAAATATAILESTVAAAREARKTVTRCLPRLLSAIDADVN
jgi:hypothetical protein